MENKLTPVEWVVKELWDIPKDDFDWHEIRKTAMKIEKEQLTQLPTWDDVKKAIQMAREIKDDSAHDTFTVEDIAGCTEVCTYGWREKYTDEQIIEGLKKQKDANEKD